MTRVLIIDDHPIVLQGCRMLLEGAGVEDIEQARSVSEGFQLYRKHKPDVIIVDLALRGEPLDGLSFLRRLRQRDQETPVIVFSMHCDPAIVSRALEVGANGYVLKDAAGDELLMAVRNVRDGKRYLSHQLALDVIFSKLKQRPRLTSREVQTLALLSQGKTYSVIAGELRVSYKTVANMCTQLKTKLGARSRPGLMRLAVEYLPAAAQAASRSDTAETAQSSTRRALTRAK